MMLMTLLYLQSDPSKLPSYLHTEASLGSCEGQNLDFDPLAFADHVSHVCYTALSAKLGDVDQALPSFPAEQRFIRWTEGCGRAGMLMEKFCSRTVTPPTGQSIQTA